MVCYCVVYGKLFPPEQFGSETAVIILETVAGKFILKL
jgi:hypothetical protein